MPCARCGQRLEPEPCPRDRITPDAITRPLIVRCGLLSAELQMCRRVPCECAEALISSFQSVFNLRITAAARSADSVGAL